MTLRPLVRRARRWVLALAVALAAVACTGGELSSEAALDLQDRVAEVRAAAEARDVPAAEQALADLRAALDAHTASGQVDDDRAAQIAGAADLVADRLGLLAPDPEPRDADPPEAEAPPTTEATPEPQETRAPPSTQPPLGPPDDRDDEEGDDRDGDSGDDSGDGGDSDEGGDDEADGGDEDGRGPDGAGPPGQRSARR